MRYLLLFFLVSPLSLLAGFHIILETRNYEQEPAVVGEVHIYSQGPLLKFEQPGGKGDMLFHGGEQRLLMLNHEEKTWIELNPEMMKAFARNMTVQMEQARARMEANLAKIPESHREQMRKIMEQQFARFDGSASNTRPEIKKTDQIRKVGAHSCTLYEVWRQGTKTMEIWMADLASIGMDPAEFAGFRALGVFFDEAVSSGNNPLFAESNNPFFIFKTVEGFPMLIREFKKGLPIEDGTLKGVKEKELKASIFTPPEGYKPHIPGPRQQR